MRQQFSRTLVKDGGTFTTAPDISANHPQISERGCETTNPVAWLKVMQDEAGLNATIVHPIPPLGVLFQSMLPSTQLSCRVAPVSSFFCNSASLFHAASVERAWIWSWIVNLLRWLLVSCSFQVLASVGFAVPFRCNENFRVTIKVQQRRSCSYERRLSISCGTRYPSTLPVHLSGRVTTAPGIPVVLAGLELAWVCLFLITSKRCRKRDILPTSARHDILVKNNVREW